MRTTTVTWTIIESVPEEQFTINKERLDNLAAGIAGPEFKSNSISKVWDTAANTVTFKRTWPNLESATAWVNAMLAEGAVSAVVDPE